MLETEPELIQAYVATGKVKIVYRHLLQLGERTVRASEASECAADQGKFWEMRDVLYRQQDAIYAAENVDDLMVDLAGGLGLDTQVFTECLQSNKHLGAIEADYQASQEAGVRSRPVFDIDGTRLIGALPFEQFQQVIGE